MIVKPEKLVFDRPRGFIALDGVNGAGKSTLMHKIMERLSEKSLPALATREPGSTDLGVALRKILLESSPGRVAPLAELFLFAADRHNHVKQVIEPALCLRRLVVSDRYYYSTAAFQGYGRNLELAAVNAINTIAIDSCLPDLLLLLDLDPQEGLRRTRSRNDCGEKDSFESEEIEFHRRLRRGFLESARTCREPVLVIDASQNQHDIWSVVGPVIDQWTAAVCAERAAA